MKDLRDTICALSTPPGRSGIAVVRVSGPASLDIFRRLFHRKSRANSLPPRHAGLGTIKDPTGGWELDEAIAICYAAPQSYTGEDMVEFSLHGSPVLVAALLDCLCDCGARPADPGEFTLRAFLHGRLDLAQAEAVHDLIQATTLFQARVAVRQSSGELSRSLKPFKDMLIDIIVDLESAVEFAEEDLPVASRADLGEKLERIRVRLREWMDTYRRGRIVREGFRMAVAGRPNVGKSSVFNALLAEDRSIVAEMPGTTRDMVSELTNIEGIPVRLQDTAGIRPAGDPVEKMGIDRSYQAIADADAVLLVVDTSRGPTAEDLDLRKRLDPLSCIVVMNKSDLTTAWSAEEMAEFAGEWPSLDVSAKTGAGIDRLRSAILSRVMGPGGAGQDGVLITNLRHFHALRDAENDLARAAASLDEGLSEEFALVDLHGGLKKLGTLTGETGVEDILGEIFSRFCIGK